MVEKKLDNAIHEDASRVRRKNSTENYTTVRHTALNLLHGTKHLNQVSRENK